MRLLLLLVLAAIFPIDSIFRLRSSHPVSDTSVVQRRGIPNKSIGIAVSRSASASGSESEQPQRDLFYFVFPAAAAAAALGGRGGCQAEEVGALGSAMSDSIRLWEP